MWWLVGATFFWLFCGQLIAETVGEATIFPSEENKRQRVSYQLVRLDSSRSKERQHQLESDSPVLISTERRTILDQVETYLNGVETIRARFLQISGTGTYAEGKAFLSRPGHMRLEYDPPSSILIIADGRQLIYHDPRLEQTSYIGLDSTPVGLMLRSNISLKNNDNITVTYAKRARNTIEVSLVQTSDPSAGELTLLFSERPLALKQWKVKDIQGRTVTVTLYDVELGVRLDSTLFRFTDPNFSKSYTN